MERIVDKRGESTALVIYTMVGLEPFLFLTGGPFTFSWLNSGHSFGQYISLRFTGTDKYSKQQIKRGYTCAAKQMQVKAQ